jgi:alkylresorcinol/alkylpyrone synthase
LTSVLAIERFLPPYRYEQRDVIPWVERWLGESPDPNALRLLPVYESAGVAHRASVVPIEEVFFPPDLEAQNDRYCAIARQAGIDLVRRALASAGLEPAEVGLLVSVSCTGFMIPSVDAYVAEALGLGPRLVRLPITESGCAGGVVGLARAADHLEAHPERAAVVLALEFSTLTFQRWDRSATNVVSSAIFGDGGAAVVLAGREHRLARRKPAARVVAADSIFFPGTTHLMGFHLGNGGLQIILDRELAPFVERHVEASVAGFLDRQGLRRDEIARWVLHPGGRKIIEVMACRLGLAAGDLAPTEAVLQEHGNMSSVTVLFVLDEVLRTTHPRPGDRGLLGAFGPGFGAELALLEFGG